ncbi:glycosyltransferase family 4 protein [Seonamhaeicola sp. ML3]|uniref:glycosyltransferase family 4 protein n=1 Tax=Seonamhaeicola sp. ML3 TaxID=2937786 RepID=UPI00200DEB8D|nr:glycosyltransferase family 4 protein [Seonamhaeicola sp. ML3]
MSKKVLIITYYWPPAGGPGVQRWLKFVKYLPDYGIEPIVFVPENPNYALVDESLVNKIPNGTKVLRFPIKEPYKLARFFSRKNSNTIAKGVISEQKNQSLSERIMLFVRGNFFIPDARKNWVKPSVEFLSDYISNESIETIITTGPPHSLHLIGMQIKQRLNIKWIADFRDPWTTIGYHKKLKLTKRSQRKHLFLEKSVLNSADQIVATSFTTKSEFSKLTIKPISVITNGYDYEKIEPVDLDKKFSIAHIGSLLSGRNPENLWKVFADLVSEYPNFAKDFQLNFVGTTSGEVLNSIKSLGLSNYVNNIGYISHYESVIFQRKSQVLLLVEIDSKDTKSIIPGKLFEYMISHRPIIALGPKDSDVEKIISETNTGNYFYYNEYGLLKDSILSHYKAYKNNTLKTYPVGLQKYSRKKLTESLSRLL